MALGAMQDWPLRVTRLIDHAEREHGNREIVAARADGTIYRFDWKRLAHDARRSRRRSSAPGSNRASGLRPWP